MALNRDSHKKQVVELLDDLGWEYDRMSSSGQETLDKLWKLFGQPTMAESFEEDGAPDNNNRFGMEAK
tara:strand:- start:461 stop:664 length:204 start_codon:yes stop_codon:yes gene_type:complete